MNRKTRTAFLAAFLAATMVGVSFAAVPLYQLFCEVTGFGGTPVRADQAPGAVAGEVGVRFDSNIDPRLPWRFEPIERTVRIAPGARTQVAYRATNLTARATTGSPDFVVPWANLAVTGLAVPLLGVLVAALFTPSRLPLVRRSE